MNRQTLGRMAVLAAALGFSTVHAASIVTSTGATINASTMGANDTIDAFIVTYRDGTVERSNGNAVEQNVGVAVTRAKLDAASQKATPSNAVSVQWKRKLGIGADVVHTSRKLSRNEAVALMQQIAADPAVAHVEPDVRMHIVKDIAGSTVKPDAVGTSTPNDPYFSYQWHMRPGTGTVETIGTDTTSYANYGGSNASAAWLNYDGTGVVVAEIDTGVTQHPDLNLALANAGYDFITAAATSGRATDGRVPGGWDTGDWTTVAMNCGIANSSWHGTHVFGTIAAVTNNGVGVTGVAPGSQVMPLRALGHCGGATSDIADAITWASGGSVPNMPANPSPAQVISMSLGGPGTCEATDAFGSAIAGAISRGVTVVVAAGNNTDNTANYSPSSCPGVITVSSVGITGKRAFYSNYGSYVSIAGPGGGIYANDDPTQTTTPDAGFVWSTLNDGTTAPGNPIYGEMAGTSQATPHVAGVVALMIGAVKAAGQPALTPLQIQEALISSARVFPVSEGVAFGSGVVDANAAVQAALSPTMTALPSTLVSSTPVTVAGNAGTSLIYSITVPANATNLTIRTIGGTGDVSLYAKVGVPVAPNGSNADFSSAKPNTNNEAIVQTTPVTGTWYVRVTGVKTFANVQLTASYTAH
ncbi:MULTISPECIES: S8 family serine peptidase [unclassified Dyella]|uniref:S8 family serine peptidase n=2 Tax=Dyella TaxID=231454 RepID=UPI000C859DB2|nr:MULTISPECIES: S8 family serine peptidase [unclassified Dyella]MDR3444245.1 S8 family serine peptidase [Dyella sp.]PMQ06503.1 Extracellular basic protease [Dyella sp. AD56]